VPGYKADKEGKMLVLPVNARLNLMNLIAIFAPLILNYVTEA
jgi:hypothetical protein